MAYKTVKAIIKNDKLRQVHIEEIEKLESEYARTLDKKIGDRIANYYMQLEYYDAEVLNVKSNVDIRLYV